MIVVTNSLDTIDDGIRHPRKIFTVPSGFNGNGIKADELIFKRDELMNIAELYIFGY